MPVFPLIPLPSSPTRGEEGVGTSRQSKRMMQHKGLPEKSPLVRFPGLTKGAGERRRADGARRIALARLLPDQAIICRVRYINTGEAVNHRNVVFEKAKPDRSGRRYQLPTIWNGNGASLSITALFAGTTCHSACDKPPGALREAVNEPALFQTHLPEKVFPASVQR